MISSFEEGCKLLGVHNLPVFMASALLLAMSPGPDTAYILRHSGRQGWSGGSAAACGIALGICVHIVAATAGLSALLVASSRALTVAKLAGAACLLSLGLGMIVSTAKRTKHDRSAHALAAAASMKQIFWQGFLTNVLNPKVALFFLAFLPQFIASERGSKAVSFLFLGLVFDVVGTGWNLLVARMAARIAAWGKGSTRLVEWIDRSIGAVFIYLGIRLVTAERR